MTNYAIDLKKAEVTAFTLILYKIDFYNGFDSATTNEKQIFESCLKDRS